MCQMFSLKLREPADFLVALSSKGLQTEKSDLRTLLHPFVPFPLWKIVNLV